MIGRLSGLLPDGKDAFCQQPQSIPSKPFLCHGRRVKRSRRPSIPMAEEEPNGNAGGSFFADARWPGPYQLSESLGMSPGIAGLV
jgi:hypothetical protein